MSQLAFIDVEGVIKFIATEFTRNVKDLITQSLLLPVFVEDSAKVGDKHCEPLSSIKLQDDTYEVDDIVFHPHLHKHFKVYELDNRTSPGGKSYTVPKLIELEPANPKMPILISFPTSCNFPKVKVKV